MKIKLEKPFETSFIDNGRNEIRTLDFIYLNEIRINLVRQYFFYFQNKFLKSAIEFSSASNRKQQEEIENSENKIDKKAILLVLFTGEQETIDKASELLSKVAFKDENFKQPLSINDINNLLDHEDWQNIIGEFLANFWASKWGLGK